MARVRKATVLIALLAMLAAACGGGDGDAATGKSSESGTTGGGGDGAASGELSVLMTWTGSEQEAFQAVLDGFTKANPDVSVDLVQVPFGELNTQLTQQYASGNAPDVHVALPGLLRLLSQQQFLMPLDDQWDGWIDDGSYTDALRQIASVDGAASVHGSKATSTPRSGTDPTRCPSSASRSPRRGTTSQPRSRQPTPTEVRRSPSAVPTSGR